MQFKILAGTKCQICKVGTNAWKPFVTTKELEFDWHGLADNGGTWTFELAGWVMKLSARYVIRVNQYADPKARRGSFGSFGGKGVSRRRAARTLKAWKDKKGKR